MGRPRKPSKDLTNEEVLKKLFPSLVRRKARKEAKEATKKATEKESSA